MNWFFYWLHDNRILLIGATVVSAIVALIGANTINEIVIFIGLSLVTIFSIMIVITDEYVEEHSRPIKKIRFRYILKNLTNFYINSF